MAAHRYWKLCGLELSSQGGALEISEARLYAAGVLADAAATLTATIAPASGAVADLRDGSAAAAVSWPSAARSAPGFALVWDLGAGNEAEIDGLRLGAGASADTFPLDLILMHSDNGADWGQWRSVGDVAFPGAYTLSVLPDPVSLAVGAPTAWDPANKGALVDLSNTDLTAAAYNTHNARSLYGAGWGKWYWEVTVATAGSQNAPCMGIAAAAHSLTTFPGYDALSWSYYGAIGQKLYNNVGAAYGPTYTTGDVIGVALDLEAGTLKFFKNGVDLGVAHSGIPAGTYYAVVSGGSSGTPKAVMTANFGASPFAYAAPAGFRLGLGYAVALLAATWPPPRRWRRQVLDVLAWPGSLEPVPQVRTVRTAETFVDVYHGGLGRVYGTTKEKNNPANTPLRRRVLLIDERSQLAIRETWSDAATGAFEFSGVALERPYTAIALDHLHNYRAVIADNQLAEAMP